MHKTRYPLSHHEDLLKYLHQAYGGVAHLIQDEASFLKQLEEEYHSIDHHGEILCEPLSHEFARIHLCALEEKDLPLIAHLCFLSQKSKMEDVDALVENAVDASLVSSAFLKDYRAWKEAGFPLQRHSALFKEHYHPHYRVIRRSLAFWLEPLRQLASLKPGSVIAVDGHSGAGKSTLAGIIDDVYGAGIVHMDDFFLRLSQKTGSRLNEIGGNIDYERFMKEVLPYLGNLRSFVYSVYDCHSMCLDRQREVKQGRFYVVEGSYSMHPRFGDYADWTIFLDIDEVKQKERILKRNGPKMYERFVNEWIPKENAYFKAFEIQKKADLVVYV